MGSRLRENVEKLFECFCEVAAPVGEKPAQILQKFPSTFADEEVLKSVPKFAYPCEIENELVQHFSFVLTSIDSKWTFGFCRHDPKTDIALVILSALPWHENFYKFLNHIASLMNHPCADDRWKFIDRVYRSVVPLPGCSTFLAVPHLKVTFVCQSPNQFQLPRIPENRNLTEYYSAVDAHNMMMVFASMLYERRIIFTSKRLSRLSACVQACNALIYPMIWQHIYIPVLPLTLMDYLLAPMPFLIGVPTPILQRVRKNDLGEVVILDADNNTIESPFQDLESLPQDVVTNLKKALRNRSALLGDGVSRAFLRALVQLTAGYRDALTLEQGQSITFNPNAFVESRPSSMQPFLRKMLELQIFQQFIEERLNMLNSGLGFSDEFEMEACSYSAKSGSKFMQQYREWTSTMRKESSAFFRSVKDKANPAVKYAVKTVKDKGKDMKTAYKGLKWKGRANRGDTSMRFHQPRSAPSSPTSDRRPIDFAPPPKSPNDFTATTSYRKDLRIRNTNFTDSSRKQYSPLSPGSPKESDGPPERVTIDLMHELQHVIFPNTPPVDRTLKPVRSLDSLRPAWSGQLRHGSPPSTVITNRHESPPAKIALSRSSHSPSSSSNGQISPRIDSARRSERMEKASLIPISKSNVDSKTNNFLHDTNLRNELAKANYSVSSFSLKNNAKEEIRYETGNSEVKCKSKSSARDVFTSYDSVSNPWSNDPLDKYLNSSDSERLKENDPFDTSRVFTPSYLQTSILQSTNPLSVTAHAPSNTHSSATRSAYVKESPELRDLIRLDSAGSTDDFDPLLSKSSEYSSSKPMSQSLHIPEMGEGLSNPLYPYFQPLHKSNGNQQSEKPSESLGDLDLLQAYGLNFNEFNISNGDSPIRNRTVYNAPESSINNIDSTFDLTLNPPTIKSQSNWTKFE